MKKSTTRVARRPAVPTRTSTRLPDPDELSIGEEFGQHERLTTRLNRLLEQYTDGFAVLKELVQNADDAGATEVKFLYDERTNEDAMTRLLDKGMKECQGPALWVYNDAAFKDEDFENIEKLSGATKEHDTEKIGKFGLGFNAVYNLTDVPMFLSRKYFVVFDPHMSYLGKAIKNSGKPGIKIDLQKDAGLLWQCENQFKPFNGIFGCEIDLDKRDNSFDGTLFRFPLRTEEQAIQSEIKQLHYDDHEMRELLQMFLHGAKNLLIFTQNVFRVGIYNLANVSSHNPQPSLLFQVTKSQAEIQRELSFHVAIPATANKLSEEEQYFLKQCNFLQVASKCTRDARVHDVDPRKFPESSMTVNIDCNFTKSGLKYFNIDTRLEKEKVTWLVVSSMGNGQAMQFVKNHNDTSLVPSAGVAVQLVPTESDTFLPSPVVKNVNGQDVNDGNVFCYLPLPIHSGLPVHINGAFAVASNRRHLQEKLEDDKSGYGVKWNEVLMQDSVCSAYLSLLEDVKLFVPDEGSYKFHLLWPTISNVNHNCWPLMKSFYEEIASGEYSLFSNGVQWVDINKVFFLDPEFRRESQIGDASFEVFQMLYGRSKVIIDLPLDVLQSFEKCGLKKEIHARSYSKSKFFRECFFQNISIIPAYLRDVLTLHALDSRDFNLLIKQHACIPTSPSGKTLKCPSQLVNPRGEAASLFSPGDGRFPFGNEESYLNFQRRAKLEQLGMNSGDLPWSEVAERAESIHELNAADGNAALKRVEALLTFMERKIKRHPLSPASCLRLMKAKFIPVLKKPTNYPLPWKGDALQRGSQLLLAPDEVFLEEEKYRVCCTQPLVGVFIPSNVKVCLKLNTKHATITHVIQQLYQAMSARVNALNAAEYDELSRTCTAAYAYLQQAIGIQGAICMEYLRGKSFILVGKRFLSALQVAFKLTDDCSPYLFKLPQQLANAFPKVMKASGVKQMFDEKDYISSLREVKKKFGDTRLDKQNLEAAIHLAVQLAETLKVSEVYPSEVQDKWGTVYLPDSKGVMRSVPDLCIRNCPWISDDDTSVQYVNDKIPWPTCSQVGVKTRREEALQHHTIGIPCGQKEKLTNRLKRILTGYPCEKEILKELLQNADDAQATEICFIKDPRQHPQKRVFEDSWQPLQGPALCVYNNKPFTKADIDGIQNLGEGSKGDDPNKTGQYGVGFNAVYHLTDAPSFISKGDEIGDVLLVFDPNCKYAPGATPQEPGRMFNVSKTLQRSFPDVFPCYLGKNFPKDDATMFRFPLRTEQMARESKISSRPVSLKRLDTMMEELKKELFEVLLFVNNVKKITLCEVNERSGNLMNAYSVEAVMSKEDEVKRKAFADCIKKIGKLANGRGQQILPTEVPVREVSYVLNITDTLGNEEKWLIVQQIGFEKSVKKSIVDAFKDHQLGMLPRGGVACLLEKKNHRSVQRRKKAYCFLPLPFETNLPVHINGHFALDHEARRNLWIDEAGHGGYRSDWNNALLSDVVASCYLTLLVEVRTFLKLPIAQGANPCTENEILQKIEAYETFFPRQPQTDQYWKTLVDSVYQEINRRELQILPVVRRRASKRATVADVTWLPPTGSGRQQAFFNNLPSTGPFAKSPQKDTDEKQKKRRKRFEAILLESGFNLVAFSLALHESFHRSSVSTCSISCSSVIDFYGTFSSLEPLCTIGPTPCDVSETVFKNASGVKLVLRYCKWADNFLEKLQGLPLLLTQDNRLQLFSSSQPKFLSRYQDLLPCSPHIFLHELVYKSIFNDAATLKSTVLKPLDAGVFAANLHPTLSRERFGEAEFVQWYPDQKPVPNQRWIFRVWEFLYEIVSDVFSDAQMDEERKGLQIKAVLGPLFDWSILPVTETRHVQRKKTPLSRPSFKSPPSTEHFLVPLRHAASVLDFMNPDSASRKLVDVLRKLGLPELNCTPLSATSSGISVYSSSNSVTLARMLVSSLKVPASLLTSLDQKMNLDPHSIRGKLNSSDCRAILEYFSKSVSCLQDADKCILRNLPFYQATHSGFIRLDDDKVCVLPSGIPRDEIDVLESVLSVVFVESWQSLSELFKFLELECVSAVDVCCTIILTNFSILSEEARHVHLEYILSSILADFCTEDGDKQRVLDCLRNTRLVPSADGTLQTASCFHDPHVDVFRTMLSDSSFPSEPFDSPEWITFLRKIGLVHEVSVAHFKRFAEEVADEAATARTEDTYEKSKVLVHHLFSRHDVISEGLLHDARDISFVAADPVRQPLQSLCPPFSVETSEGQFPFISFNGAVFTDHKEIVWTKAHLLPQWADPRFRRYELGCPRGFSISQYCNDFLDQLQIVKKPSVDLVIRHCQAICSHLENKFERGIASPAHFPTAVAVMESIYTFLQDNAMVNSEAKKRLKTTACILVEDGRKFILPSQAVLELYERLEVKPFLYRVPPEFGKFRAFFEYLGCSKSAGPTHYAMVLEMLQERCQNAKLHPNEVSLCCKAVKGLFEMLQEDPEDAPKISKLYLPAMHPGLRSSDKHLTTIPVTIPVTLHKSAELIFDDSPAYGERIQELNQLFVLDLNLIGVSCKSAMTNYKELMMKLPVPLQPKMLSDVVKENLTNAVTVTSGAVNGLMERLSSTPFVCGIVRIIRHVNSQKKDFDEGAIANIERGLQSIQLCAVDSLKTALYCNGDLIPGSEAKVRSFQEKRGEPGEETCRVYVNVAKGMDDTSLAISLVSNVIVEIYGELLGKNAVLIPEMLRCPLSDIWSLLDRTDIRQDDTNSATRMDIYPEPGTFIPIEDHHLLNDAFVEFEPGEYVGYQLDDPSLQLSEGVATYIYAVIIEEVKVMDKDDILVMDEDDILVMDEDDILVMDEDDRILVLDEDDIRVDLLTKMYIINIEHDKEPVQVDSAALYKFHRLQDISNQQHYRNPREKQAVFDEISVVLEDAWRLPEEQRTQIVKRLILQWCPEKNLGDEEFCAEAFEHIKNEISRLGGSYDEYIDVWVARAREHGSHRKEYRERVSRESASSRRLRHNFPPSFCSRNPQPGEAKRWFRQAEADVAAVENDIIEYRTPSYEWACFKCHQAAEKALKSAQYTVDAEKTNYHDLVQNCNDLNDSELTNLASELERLVGGSARMRYPDRMCFPQIPNEVYSAQMAQQALQLAKKITARVKNRIT